MNLQRKCKHHSFTQVDGQSTVYCKYEGSSKGMEASAALLLTKEIFQNQNVITDKIDTYNDSSMKAVVQHSWVEKDKRNNLCPEFVWPVMKEGKKKKSTGLTPLDIPKPEWLADPTHQTKVVAKVFFNIKAKRKKYSNT
eukprot:9205124-Ditylum_brightwellii.AAC.1